MLGRYRSKFFRRENSAPRTSENDYGNPDTLKSRANKRRVRHQNIPCFMGKTDFQERVQVRNLKPGHENQWSGKKY